jgi:hypothetical protein
MPENNENQDISKRCFVIMGFGIKTDFATGRKLDLNKSYKLLIKPVVEGRGLTCVRADEILHSGSIDFQMYRELLQADIVIADLSTANVNAFYELGIRHALRKKTTIVISEDKLAYPFDLNHVRITSYTHLGEAIDYEEVERFRKVLGETIDTVLKIEDPDSPVYTYLQELNPPFIQNKASIPRAGRKWNLFFRPKPEAAVNAEDMEEEKNSPTLSHLIGQGEDALHKRDYKTGKAFFSAALKLMNDDASRDPYIIQRLAYSTYKSKEPDPVTALNEAIKLLSRLDLEHTNDTETVALAGRIEKKLYAHGLGDTHLANAILFYERGYFLLCNRYHGINLAFLLNKRVDSSLDTTNDERLTDMVSANRIRRQVLQMCDRDWTEMMALKDKMELKNTLASFDKPADYNMTEEVEQMYWILVNKAEAHYGLGEMNEYRQAVEKSREVNPADWMIKSFNDQHVQLRDLLVKYGALLTPAWNSDSN